MISLVKIKGYRIFEDLEVSFSSDNNTYIFIGDNGAGKSTLLEAIELVLTGKINSRPIQYEINPYIFNVEIVKKYFSDFSEYAAGEGKKPNPPVIAIEVFFDKEDCLAKFQGVNNSNLDDVPGFTMAIQVEDEDLSEFELYVRKGLERKDDAVILPVEFYTAKWKSFKDEVMFKKPKELSVGFIDSSNASSVDLYMRDALDSFLTSEQKREISLSFRQAQHQIDKNALEDLSRQMRLENAELDLGLTADLSSRTRWQSVVTPEKDSLPLMYTGDGSIAMARMMIAFGGAASSKVILIEEPENHLSHTSLREIISWVTRNAASFGCQVFVCTHSPYVLNRLGLDGLRLVNRDKVSSISNLTSDTIEYFKRLSGFDTLRIALSKKLVLVEGPSDEMIFNWAYMKVYGRYPEDDCIDVMEYGTRGKRALELAASFNKSPIAVLRDNDGSDHKKWQSDYRSYLSTDQRVLFVGEKEKGWTLEPQFVNANINVLDKLRAFFDLSPISGIDDIEKWMKSHKTEWALKIVEAQSDIFIAPDYISEAVEFIHEH